MQSLHLDQTVTEMHPLNEASDLRQNSSTQVEMRLGDGGTNEGERGHDEGVRGCMEGGRDGMLPTLQPDQWSAAPDTGLVTMNEAVMTKLVNSDPIEQWYQFDPEPIARGQFAVVYHCQHRVTGEEFAAKFSSRLRLGTDCTADILHEVAVCAMLRPTHRTVQLRDVFSTETEMVLVMEYAAGGDLQTLLDEDMVPYERDVIGFTRQLLEGLVFIHDLNLVHLDIKPQNLVLMGEFPDCALKLCDFEISRILTPGREVREILGTPDYVAPEILLYEPITKKTDMWSLGVLTYVLLTGFLPFGGDTDQETFLQISRGELDFPEELFEDISAEAIDFIKRLLVRQPERRMSAQECLDHAWMKKEVTRPIPPSTLNLSNTITSTITTPTVIKPPATNTPSVIMPPPSTMTPVIVSTPNTNTPVIPIPPPTATCPAIVPALTTPTSASVPPPPTTTPVVDLPTTPTVKSTPTTITPLIMPSPTTTTPVSQPAPTTAPILPDITSPTVDIGRPPFHPHMPVRHTPSLPDPTSFSNLASPITFLPPFALYSLQRQESRFSSRHNLDRIRSMSKSREVLSGRIQMSNLKKTISKSRERLFDAKLSLSKSRERLIGLRSFSQSVEALTALSQLNQDNAVYQSCNSIFRPAVTPNNKENDITCRMYRSLAAIDQIEEIGDCSHKLGYFESRFNKDDEDYNDLVTRHNTNLNTLIVHDGTKSGSSTNEARLRGGGRGGRGSEVCDKRCPRHTHRQPEAQPTQKIPKVNRAERMKREAQRRRKDKKEKEKEDNDKLKPTMIHEPTTSNKTSHEKSNEGSASPNGRRRSVSHVEQRLAERHERQQEKHDKQHEKHEKQERQLRSERRNSVTSRRRNSVDLDRSPVSERLRPNKSNSNSNSLSVTQEKPRSTTPTRKLKTKKTSSASSDVSQASSLESVDGTLDSPRSRNRPKRPTSLNLPEIKIFPDEFVGKPVNATDSNTEDNIRSADIDEAYVSLDEPCTTNKILAAFSGAWDTTDSETKIEHVATEPQENSLNKPSESSLTSNTNRFLTVSPVREPTDNDENTNLLEASQLGLALSGELTIIQEEDDSQVKQKTPTSYIRSVSTTSDVGSMLSEGSELSEFGSRSPGTDTEFSLDWHHQGHTLSPSSQHNSVTGSKSQVRPRSRSMIHDPPVITDVARPWGNVCDGAVARALGKFNIKDEDNKPSGRSRRVSSPALPVSVDSSLLSR